MKNIKKERQTLTDLIEFCDNRITESGIKIGHYANLKKMYQKQLEEIGKDSLFSMFDEAEDNE